MSSRSRFRSNLNTADLADRPGLILGSGLVGLTGLLLLWFMWPLVILSGLIGGGVWLWRQQQLEQTRRARQQQRLNRKFYELLQHRQGRVSALELAMHTRLSGATARRYLHQQAQSLGACFERTVNGDVVYIFNLTAMYDVPPAMTPAEIAWAYAERERAIAQHYTQQYRNAQAKQIQALRQLSQRQLSQQKAADDIMTIDVSAADG